MSIFNDPWNYPNGNLWDVASTNWYSFFQHAGGLSVSTSSRVFYNRVADNNVGDATTLANFDLGTGFVVTVPITVVRPPAITSVGWAASRDLNIQIQDAFSASATHTVNVHAAVNAVGQTPYVNLSITDANGNASSSANSTFDINNSTLTFTLDVSTSTLSASVGPLSVSTSTDVFPSSTTLSALYIQLGAANGTSTFPVNLQFSGPIDLSGGFAILPPGPPGAPVATGVTQFTANVTWTPSSTSTVDSYELQSSPTGISTWITAGSTSTLSSTLDGLIPNTVYDLRVQAHDGSTGLFSIWAQSSAAFSTAARGSPIQAMKPVTTILYNKTVVDPSTWSGPLHFPSTGGAVTHPMPNILNLGWRMGLQYSVFRSTGAGVITPVLSSSAPSFWGGLTFFLLNWDGAMSSTFTGYPANSTKPYPSSTYDYALVLPGTVSIGGVPIGVGQVYTRGNVASPFTPPLSSTDPNYTDDNHHTLTIQEQGATTPLPSNGTVIALLDDKLNVLPINSSTSVTGFNLIGIVFPPNQSPVTYTGGGPAGSTLYFTTLDIN